MTNIKPTLQKILKGILHKKECNHENMGENKSHQMNRYTNEE
jgi:hypothetical protein